IVDTRSVGTFCEGGSILFEGVLVSPVIGIDFPNESMELKRIRIEFREFLNCFKRPIHVEAPKLVECVRILRIPSQRFVELIYGLFRALERNECNRIVVMAAWVWLGRCQFGLEAFDSVLKLV